MRILLSISIILLTAVGCLLLFDLVPMAKRWLARIHIGQWKNNEDWQSAVAKTLFNQLKKTPAVPVSDQTRLTVIERLKGNYTNKNLQSWQEASLLLGANEIFKDKADDNRIREFINRKIDSQSGDWRNSYNTVDSSMLAYAILSAPVSDKSKMKPAMDSTAQMLLSLAEKYGTIPYSSALPDIRFVDTVGMVCPFLFKYGLEYDCEEAVEAAKRQIEEYVGHGMHPELKMPVHCYDTATKAPLGLYGWGRGCGWLAIGLMDSYLTLNSFKNEKAEIVDKMGTAGIRRFIMNQMITFAQALTDFQMDNGAWARHIFIKDMGETSATAMLGWFMKMMWKLTENGEYQESARKAEQFLMSSTRVSGVVDFAQGDTKGIGFYSVRMDAMPAAQGFTGRGI